MSDNELDKAQTRLELTEKKFKEKSKSLEEAKVEAENLKRLIEAKEKRLKVVNDQQSQNNGTLQTSTTRYHVILL